jgi:transcriptional regulator with XRE-family HTH domain
MSAMAEAPDYEFRSPSKEELSMIVRLLRMSKGWTQETLAELAGVSSRTIQRLEDGQGGSADTLRAVARAVEAEDLDFLLRPQQVLTEAGLQRRQAEFERDYMQLDAAPALTGSAVEAFMTDLTMLCCVGHDVENPATQDTAASLFDFLRDYLDIKSELTYQDRLSMARSLDELVATLRADGWTPIVAHRRTKLMNDHWADKAPWPVTIGYIALVRAGQEPAKLAVLRRIQLE